LLIFCILALTEVLDDMLQSKKLQRELATKIKNDLDLHKLLSKVVFSNDDAKVDVESREADPEWFEGLSPFVPCGNVTCSLNCVPVNTFLVIR